MSFGTAGNWVEIVGLVAHDSAEQRELQYEVEVGQGEIRITRYFGKDISAFGWEIKLTRLDFSGNFQPC